MSNGYNPKSRNSVIVDAARYGVRWHDRIEASELPPSVFDLSVPILNLQGEASSGLDTRIEHAGADGATGVPMIAIDADRQHSHRVHDPYGLNELDGSVIRDRNASSEDLPHAVMSPQSSRGLASSDVVQRKSGISHVGLAAKSNIAISDMKNGLHSHVGGERTGNDVRDSLAMPMVSPIGQGVSRQHVILPSVDDDDLPLESDGRSIGVFGVR